MGKRIKTKYVGVFYRIAKRLGGAKGTEKVYYIFFKKDGKPCEEKVGRQYADNMTPAKASRLLSERIEGKRPSRKEIREKEKSRMTIDKIWQQYRENQKNKDTVNDVSRYKNYIKPRFGNKEPGQILPLDIDRFKRRDLKDKAPGTIRNILELLRRIINYGVKKNLCPSLLYKIEMPKVDNIKTEDLSPEQIANLLKAIDEDIHPVAGDIMKMVLFTGMRKSELLHLQSQDVDFQRGFIQIKSPKGGISQTIPLNDSARKLLDARPKNKKSDYIFPGKGKNQIVNITKSVNKIKEKANLAKDFRPLHGLRHVYASMLASSGQVDMYTLQKLLTHKDPKMTQRYAHLRDETLRKASNLAGQIIEEAAK